MKRSGKRRAGGGGRGGDDGLPEKMKLKEACRFLGVSHAKVTALVDRGVLPVESDPLDKRVKLVKVSDLVALLDQRGAGGAAAGRGGVEGRSGS